jgi:guanylate kinase
VPHLFRSSEAVVPEPAGHARLIVVSGPSGVGKGTVIAELGRRELSIWVSVSVTTRAPRPGEIDGVTYHFVSDAEFDRMIEAGELLEYDRHFAHAYGTPRQPVLDRIAAGIPVLLEIDLLGARQVRSAMPEALLVFLAPPSWTELERRLTARGTEDPAATATRLDRARMELAAQREFDVVIVNGSVEQACDELVKLL